MKIIRYNIDELNKLLKQHGTLTEIAPFVINEHDNQQGTTLKSLSRWLKNNGYYLDVTVEIKQIKEKESEVNKNEQTTDDI